jgi:hypothetical protein
MNKMRKIRSVVTLLVLCCCYTMSFSQTFESKLGGLVEGNIGDPLIVTSDGVTIFAVCDYASYSIYLTAYNENHNPLYIRKKLNFSKKEVIENVFNFMYDVRALYYKPGVRPIPIIAGIFQNNNSIFFNLSSKKNSYAIEVDYRNGTIVTETEKEYLGAYISEGREYNLANTKYVKIVSIDIDKDVKQKKLVIYDLNNKILDECSLPKDFYAYSFLRFERDQVFIAKFLENTLQVIKYDTESKKITSKYVALERKNEKKDYSKEFIVFSQEGKSLVAYWEDYDKTGDKKRVLYTCISTADLKNSSVIELSYSARDQYLNNFNLKLKDPKFLQVVSNNSGNTLGMSIPYDHINSATPIISFSCHNLKGDELYSFAYKFKVRAEDHDVFFENVIPLSISNKHIVFLNNIEENFNLKIEDKTKKVITRMGQKPIAIELDEKGNTSQYYVFGTKENQNESSYVEFKSSYFDKKTNTLVATMYIDDYRNSKPVWIKLK